MNMENVNLIIEWYRGHCPNTGVYATVNQEPYEPLVIALQGDELQVGYRWEQNGKLVPDPLIVIKLKEQTGRVTTMFWSGSDDLYIHHFLGEVAGRLKRLDESDKIEWK